MTTKKTSYFVEEEKGEDYKVTLASFWAKLRTRTREQNTILILAVALVLVIGIGIASSLVISNRWQTASTQWHQDDLATGKVEGFKLGLAANNAENADFLVTKAGDDTYNGYYHKKGSYGSYPAYTNDTRWIVSPAGNYWVFTPNPNGANFPYQTNSRELTGNWHTNSPGIAPAPTVTISTHASPSFMVSGAGDPTYNGPYFRSGDFEGETAYTNGYGWMYKKKTPHAWYVGNSVGAYPYAYVGSSETPAGHWDIGSGKGTTPAPTVVAIENGKVVDRDTGHAKQ
jgi:hypothetical protein